MSEPYIQNNNEICLVFNNETKTIRFFTHPKPCENEQDEEILRGMSLVFTAIAEALADPESPNGQLLTQVCQNKVDQLEKVESEKQ